jgi:VCBS repeat-containing protein
MTLLLAQEDSSGTPSHYWHSDGINSNFLVFDPNDGAPGYSIGIIVPVDTIVVGMHIKVQFYTDGTLTTLPQIPFLFDESGQHPYTGAQLPYQGFAYPTAADALALTNPLLSADYNGKMVDMYFTFDLEPGDDHADAFGNVSYRLFFTPFSTADVSDVYVAMNTAGTEPFYEISLDGTYPQLNQPPVIDAAHSVVVGTVSERTNTTGSSAVDYANGAGAAKPPGAIAFSDPDTSDRPTASIDTGHETITYQGASGQTYSLTATQIAALEAGFSIAPEAGNTNSGKIDWTYKITDSTLDFLGAGETVTVTAPVIIDDGHGGTVTQNVVVTISGADDKPFAVPAQVSLPTGNVVSVDVAHGILSGHPDPDTHDLLSVTAITNSFTSRSVPAGQSASIHGHYGTLTMGADGHYAYTEDVTALVPSNGAGDVFTYTIGDGHGGSARSTVTIDILPNHAPSASPDTDTVAIGGKVQEDAAHGVLTKTTDTDGDALAVVAVNGGRFDVGNVVQGRYGDLTLNADGSYAYHETAGHVPTGAEDVFKYTVSDGHGGSAQSTLTVDITPTVLDISGGSILNDAIQKLGQTWGNENCTGFGFTVAHDVGLIFFDTSAAALTHTGPYGSLIASPNNLLNIASGLSGSLTDGLNNFGFFTPVTDNGQARADVTNDNFSLVADSGNHKTSNILSANSPSDLPQPGDIFRGVVSQANGRAVTHEGIVAAYDVAHNVVWLVDNWVSDHVGQYVTGTAEIGYHRFNLNSSATPTSGAPVITGPYTFYRANGVSLNDNILGSNGVDHLGGGAGNDTITGGAGDDILWGGLGTNRFVYANGWGHDTIMDWTAGNNNRFDMTALASIGVHNLADLSQAVVNGNDVISHGGDIITLIGVSHTLQTASFIFA